MVVIAVGSGKGGVGKTTISANLATALAFFGKTVVIDSDIALPNLHTHFGVDDPFVSLLDVLKDPNYLEESIYSIRLRFKENERELHVIPASTSVKALEEINIENFKKIVETLRDGYDYIVVDVAAGLSKYALVPMLSADRAYLVVNPDKASILDSQKVRKIADISGVEIGGVIVNRYRGEKKMVEYAEKIIGSEVVGIVRESEIIKRSWETGYPVLTRKPNSPVARDIFKLSMNIAGIDKQDVKPYGRLKYILGW